MRVHDSTRHQLPTIRSLKVRTPSGLMAVDRYGDSRIPVLLLHGIPGDRLTWLPVAERLARAGRSAIAPDLIGFGESEDSVVPLHALQQAGQLVAMLDEMREDSVHVVGFDFGGPTAVHLAARLGSRAVSLTLANTNIFPDSPVPLPLRVASVPYLGDLAFRLFFCRAGLSMMWVMAVRERHTLTFQQFRNTLRRSRTVRTTRLIFLESLRHLRSLYGPIQQSLEHSSTPALVIWSDRDPFFSAEIGRRTASAAGGRLQMLAGCGHFTPQERPAEFADAILKHCVASENTHFIPA
jgi:pimeloyl-ACP methyl ester carboxylesterase